METISREQARKDKIKAIIMEELGNIVKEIDLDRLALYQERERLNDRSRTT